MRSMTIPVVDAGSVTEYPASTPAPGREFVLWLMEVHLGKQASGNFIHSARSALMGSTSVARRAGSQQASNATNASEKIAIASAPKSSGPTP